MTNFNAPMWGIHAGATGDADTLFLQKNCIALGWPDMGDLGQIQDDKNAFQQRLALTHPNSKPGAIPVNAGQLRRFAHEMQVGDLVIYPSKQDRQIHIGEVISDYNYEATNSNYPNQRSVTWLKQSPRSDFLPAALFEVGAAMSLFRVKNYTSNFLAVLQGQTGLAVVPPSTTITPGVTTDTDNPPLSADSIEESTRDFILEKLASNLAGHPLANLVANLFEVMGYRTRVSPPGPDGGVDIVAYKDEFELLPPIIKVQVKSGKGSVGGPEVQQLKGTLGQSEYGILVTLSTFTSAARSSEKSTDKIRLIDGAALTDLVLLHYEALDLKYKNIVPLKRVYAPDDTDYQSN